MLSKKKRIEQKDNKRKKLQRQIPFHLMLLPGLLVVLIYNYLPMGGLVMAFQNYRPVKGFLKSDFVGFANFTQLFHYPDIERIIKNTLVIAVAKMILSLLASLVFALLLNEVKNRYFYKFVQTMTYLPNFLSWVILAGIFTNILSPSAGIVNRMLGAFGMEKIYFLGDNRFFQGTLILTDVWKGFGYGSIMFLAALTGIDQSLYEAAEIDGAGRWKQTLYVTLPGIASIVFVVAVLSLGNVLNAGFDQVLNLYSPQVYESGDILDTFIYRIGLVQAQYSLSAAVGFVKSLISLVLIALSYWLAHKFGEYQIF